MCPQVYLQGTRPDPATGLLPPAEALEYPAALAWLRVGPACLALLGEGGQAFVQPLAASGVEGAVQLRCGSRSEQVGMWAGA